MAADNIVKEWEQLDNGKLSKKNNLFKLKTIANLKEFKGKIISQSFLNNDKNSIHNSAKYKFPKITSNELETITNNLRKTLNRFENVNVEQFSDRLILVNKKNN